MSSVSPANSHDEIARRFASIVRSPRDQEALFASIIAEPGALDEIAELVRACEAERVELAAFGTGRTLAEIRRRQVGVGVSLRKLNRIVEYDPADMTVTVEGGVTLGELNRTIASGGQRLPIDAAFPDQVTVGALIAASHSGPLRVSEGTVRDLLIGIRYVGSNGRAVHGGGRVVKNVAGYDLMKVLTGSFGTLGIITEATFKVRPIPEHYALARMEYDHSDEAFEAARRVYEALSPAHLEVLSPAAARACELGAKYCVLAGISGNRAEVTSQRDAIKGIIGGSALLENESASEAYARLRDIDVRETKLAARIAMPPAELGRALSKVGADFSAHAGSGVAEIFLGEAPVDARARVNRWREIAREVGGHLRVLHCESASRSEIDFFDLPNEGSLELMRRLKAAFDPMRIFNPGCFVGGI